ncbi:heterokaryon incompatibility protein-domain-containing protein [Rhexocercosporidium sp. MPI-PUGE-AT-0058]|nr:heterokaryon incompatibility protein-domain-containing protein [Rhexocercosporidium sp. MPI-PUGE-AT-0058]
MVSPSSYPEKDNIFPNRGHWDENGVWVPSRNKEALCWCPKGVPIETNLCERCRDLRLRHLILCEDEGRMIDLGKLDVMIRRPGCDLCSLFVLGCKQTWRDSEWEDEGTGSQTSVYLNAVEASRQRANGYKFQISEFHTGKPYQWVEFDVVFRGHGTEIKTVEKSFEVSPQVDMDFLRDSLKTCGDGHASCRGDQLPTPTDMRIIDLESMSITPAPEGCRYCALSYVWGKITVTWLTLTRENMASLSSKNALVGAFVPQTVQDAMKLCVELGERYLWVDSLCIVQNDPVFQKQQIDIMDTIYAAATFTIVAASGDHANAGLPGISTWSRIMQRQTITIMDIEFSNTIPVMKDTVDISIWNSRGWTYQEHMFSRRCIFLTDAQAYIGCNEGVQYERPDRIEAENWTIGLYKPSRRLKTFLDTYKANVTDYTLRSLTSQADILRAFQGVLNDMSKRYSQTFYFGLPRDNFIDALLWQPAHHTVRRFAPGCLFPSWSWASMNGAIKYSFVEERITPTSTIPIPAFWGDDEEPELFQLLYTLETECQALLGRPQSSGLGRLMFSTQCVNMFVRNSVPFDYNDNLWTDYTQDIDQTHISIASILSSPDASEPAGFIELDKLWAGEKLATQEPPKSWSFIAISVAVMKADDIMNRFFTQRRNTDCPRVLSRNVREIVVNVMLVQWEGDVASRLGVGKIYLDFWEDGKPETKVVVLE